MKRPLPSSTAGLAKSVVDYSKKKTRSKNSRKRPVDVDPDAERVRELLNHKLKRIEMFGIWFPRVLVFPFALMSILIVFITIKGIWIGAIPAVSRGSSVSTVLQISNPIYFWLSTTVYAGVSVIGIYMTIMLLKWARWFPSSKT